MSDHKTIFFNSNDVSKSYSSSFLNKVTLWLLALHLVGNMHWLSAPWTFILVSPDTCHWRAGVTYLETLIPSMEAGFSVVTLMDESLTGTVFMEVQESKFLPLNHKLSILLLINTPDSYSLWDTVGRKLPVDSIWLYLLAVGSGNTDSYHFQFAFTIFTWLCVIYKRFACYFASLVPS